jgi:hypothetical protein
VINSAPVFLTALVVLIVFLIGFLNQPTNQAGHKPMDISRRKKYCSWMKILPFISF